MKIRMGLLLVTAGVLAQTPPPQPAQATTSAPAKGPNDIWPQTVAGGKASFTIYQPQIDSWDGTTLHAYCAVGATLTGEKNPAFGLLHFSAHTSIDHHTRMVYFDNYKVEKIEFPGAEQRAGELESALRVSSVKTIKKISLDRFESGLAAVDAAKQARTIELKHDPPKIIFQVVPSMLVLIDGEPVFKPWEKTSLERVINTRPLLLKSDDGK